MPFSGSNANLIHLPWTTIPPPAFSGVQIQVSGWGGDSSMVQDSGVSPGRDNHSTTFLWALALLTPPRLPHEGRPKNHNARKLAHPTQTACGFRYQRALDIWRPCSQFDHTPRSPDRRTAHLEMKRAHLRSLGIPCFRFWNRICRIHCLPQMKTEPQKPSHFVERNLFFGKWTPF